MLGLLFSLICFVLSGLGQVRLSRAGSAAFCSPACSMSLQHSAGAGVTGSTAAWPPPQWPGPRHANITAFSWPHTTHHLQSHREHSKGKWIILLKAKHILLDFLSNTRKCLYRKNRRLWTITIAFPISLNLILFLTRDPLLVQTRASTHTSFIFQSIFSGSYIKCILHHNITYVILKVIHILFTFLAKLALYDTSFHSLLWGKSFLVGNYSHNHNIASALERGSQPRLFIRNRRNNNLHYTNQSIIINRNIVSWVTF